MKKAKQHFDESREEYCRDELGQGVRGKYFAQMQSVIIVAIDPDVAAVFPDDKAVNDALRSLMHTTAPGKDHT